MLVTAVFLLASPIAAAIALAEPIAVDVTNASEPIASLAEAEIHGQQGATPEVSPVPAGLTSGAAANETKQLRRGFLKQLLSRVSSGKK